MKQKKIKFREFTEEEQKELDEWIEIYGNDGVTDEEIEEINREHLKSAENED